MKLSLFVLLLLAGIGLGDATPIYPERSKLLVLRDGAGKETPIADAAGWAKRRAHILQNMQAVMGPLPGEDRKVAFDAKSLEESDEGTFIRHKLILSVEKDDRLPVYLLVPKAKGKKPAVVCLHPTSKEFGKAVAAGVGGKSDRHYAVHLAERGYITIAPDYPNMGEYKFDAYKNGYISTTMKAIWNHMRCVDYLISRPDVDGDRIGVIGHSLGGHNAIFLGVFDERVKCIVSNCGFCSFSKYMKGNLTGWSHDGYMPLIRSKYDLKPEKMPWDFQEAVAALAPRAFLASAPIKDHNFDVEGVKDCITAATPVFKLLGAEEKLKANYPDADHNFPDDVRKVAYEFLDRWLKQ